MKKNIFAFTFITILSSGIIFSSCQSSAEKVENAQENVKDANESLQTAQKDSNIAAIKTANAEEWKAFKAASELKIDNNKIRIDELKIKMNSTGKTLDEVYEKRIDSLKERNADLRTRMNKYETGKTDWESFKSEFNRDMDGLGKALKEFTVSNKK